MSHELSRRGFLAGLGAVVAGLAIEEAIPLGRVWSFPKNIVLPEFQTLNVRLPARYLGTVTPIAFNYPIEYTKLLELSSPRAKWSPAA